MKTLISKIRRFFRRIRHTGKFSLALSIGLPGLFKVEIRYSAEITGKAVNDNRRSHWRLRAERRRRLRR